MERLLNHPISLTLLVFGLVFLLPVTLKLVRRLSIDSTPLEWIIAFVISAITALTLVISAVTSLG